MEASMAGPGDQAELLAKKRITGDSIEEMVEDLPADRWVEELNKW